MVSEVVAASVSLCRLCPPLKLLALATVFPPLTNAAPSKARSLGEVKNLIHPTLPDLITCEKRGVVRGKLSVI